MTCIKTNFQRIISVLITAYFIIINLLLTNISEIIIHSHKLQTLSKRIVYIKCSTLTEKVYLMSHSKAVPRKIQ